MNAPPRFELFVLDEGDNGGATFGVGGPAVDSFLVVGIVRSHDVTLEIGAKSGEIHEEENKLARPEVERGGYYWVGIARGWQFIPEPDSPILDG